MRKRLLKTILTGMLLLLCPMTAFAEESQQTDSNDELVCEVTLEVPEECDYIVTVPKKLAMDYETYSGEFVINSEGNIADNYVISIVPDSSFELTQGDKKVTATVVQTKTQWGTSELDGTHATTGIIYTDKVSGGTWSGSFGFVIEVKDLKNEENIDKTIELSNVAVVNDEAIILSAGEYGSVKLIAGGLDLTSDFIYTCDNPNITITDGIINTSNAKAGDVANITAVYANTYSMRETEALAASFTVKVEGVSLDKEAVYLTKGEVGSVTASVVSGTENTDSVKFKTIGLDSEVNENTVSITTSEDTKEGVYTLIAEYNGYTEVIPVHVSNDSNPEVEDVLENIEEETIIGNEDDLTDEEKEDAIKDLLNNTEDTVIVDGTDIDIPEENLDKVRDELLEDIKEHEHQWSEGFVIDVKAGCESNGSKSIHCSGCEEVKDVTSIEPTGHTYVEGKCEACGQDEPIQYNLINLLSTAGEVDGSSGFMGSTFINEEYIRSNIYKVVIYGDKSRAEGHLVTDDNCWDITAEQNGSMIAWVDMTNTINGYAVYMAPTVDNAIITANENCDYMFANLNKGKSNTIIKGIEYIDFSNTTSADAFLYDSSVYDKFEYPKTLKVVGNSAFANATVSTQEMGPSVVIIPEGVTTIEANAFKNCTRLNTVVLPSTLENIETNAFYNTSIEEVKIPDSVKCIGDYAFKHTNLTEVNLPKDIQFVGREVFDNTPWLTDSVTDNDTGMVIVNDVLISVVTTEEELVLPEGVEVIAAEAVKGNSTIKKIELPSTLKHINDDAFKGCDKIESIIIPSSVETIGSNILAKCSKLTEVVFENVTGWYVTETRDLDEDKIVLQNLSELSKDYITNTYANYYWSK